MRRAFALMSLLSLVSLNALAADLGEVEITTPAVVTVVNDSSTRPSCDIVRLRLQYREARMQELANLVGAAGRPHHVANASDLKQIADLEARSQVDAKELDLPTVQLHASWQVPTEVVALANVQADGSVKSYSSAEQVWSSPNGYLPPSLRLNLDGLANIASLDTTLSLTQLCTLDPSFTLTLETPAGEQLLMKGDWSAAQALK